MEISTHPSVPLLLFGLQSISVLLFWLAYGLDMRETMRGVLPDVSNEANPLIRYALKCLSFWMILLIALLYGSAVSWLLLLRNLPGLWIGYSALFGHVLGFLSWRFINQWRLIRRMLAPVASICFLLAILGVCPRIRSSLRFKPGVLKQNRPIMFYGQKLPTVLS
jgi:hypothetical protein